MDISHNIKLNQSGMVNACIEQTKIQYYYQVLKNATKEICTWYVDSTRLLYQ
jgi:hypothetical protein